MLLVRIRSYYPAPDPRMFSLLCEQRDAGLLYGYSFILFVLFQDYFLISVLLVQSVKNVGKYARVSHFNIITNSRLEIFLFFFSLFACDPFPPP